MNEKRVFLSVGPDGDTLGVLISNVIVHSQSYPTVKVCSQLLLIFLIRLSAEIGSVRQHSENNPDEFMGCSKNSLLE